MSDNEADLLRRRIAKLEKINAALIERVERGPGAFAAPYDLFRANIELERTVRQRTSEVKESLRQIETMNWQLVAARDEAERANRRKTRFLAQVGHDLLQPVNAARLSLIALRERRPEVKNELAARRIERALASIEESLRTLLDLSRLDSGAMTPNVRAVNLGELLADLAVDYGAVAARRGLVLTISRTSAVVLTDRAMITRVLQNLVSNALRYTPSGHILVGVRRRAGAVRIDVIDTGSGIPEDQQEVVFEEFHRGGGRLPEGEVSLGLGLSIVRRLVESLGHRLTLVSRPGRGSRFSVEVEHASDDEARELGAPMPAAPAGLFGAIVVIVDDDAATRQAIAELLLAWGCAPVQAAGSVDAASVTAQIDAPPRLLLVDYHLDGEIGIEAIERFHAALALKVPAIVMSADEAIADAVAAAGLMFIRKPLRPAELRAVLSSCLSGSSAEASTLSRLAAEARP